jgi:hypothetical protein
MLKIKTFSFLFLCFVLPFCGCGQPNRGTVPVTVEIQYDGKPVSEASITLLNSEGKYAVGTTDVSGIARIFTYIPNDGAIPGHYQVSVDKHETIFPDTPVSAADDTGSSQGEIKHVYHIPKKYADISTSGLSLEVVKGKQNHFLFQLNDN